MSVIGVFSDSEGDVELFDAALKVLASKGARRFLFAGGRYDDLDDWVKWRREGARAATDYTSDHFLEDVTRWLIGLEQVDRPAAFGTAYEIVRQAEEAARLKDRVLRTPERGSLSYQDPNVPKKAMDMLGDVLCCVVHDKNDLAKDDMLNAVVLVHGKETEAKVVQIGPRFFVTPGRLKGGKAPTVGLLSTADRQITFSAVGLDGQEVLAPQPLNAGPAKTKISVK